MHRIASKLFIVMAITAIGAFGADNSVGTWKFNAEKSKSTSTNPLGNRIMVREATPDGGIKVAVSGKYADGTPDNYSYTCKYDGKACPVTGASFDTLSFVRIDDNSWNYEVKKSDGKYHMKGKYVISRDGKTMTQTATGTDAAGKPVSQTRVFEKQ
jgi:hypothetical protein